tara:strand:+ start:1362 stop:2945 length:1584 start_codon:yes stop_codon:yes gene_type:complete
MELDQLLSLVYFGVGASLCFIVLYKFTKYSFGINSLLLLPILYYLSLEIPWVPLIMYLGCPLLLINTVLFVYLDSSETAQKIDPRYTVTFKTNRGKLQLHNIKRGASIIGAAGSGKTESVVYGFLQHFQKEQLCGVIHDYKDFELTEMAYPLFSDGPVPFKIIAFDRIIHRVNPIAPRYLENEESVNEVAKVLIENLLEHRESGVSGTTKFFNDAAEGLIGGLIWKLKTEYPQLCTLPHLIAIYQLLDTESLIGFLKTNTTSRAMADAFISGKDSDRQTAGVKSTLANALKRISTQRIFMVLSADEVPLNINSPTNPCVLSVVNNPKYEAAYAPVIATIIHTLTKQMSVRGQRPSFLMMEEAPTIRLLNMHRIPATLRSYDIATIYVMQDKIQNDMMYGDKASRAILSNLSYQFFGKVNDPDTAKYYERFFEIVKNPTKSISKAANIFKSDTRITKGEREVSKRRAEIFFKLKPGEFISFADGKDKKVKFHLPEISRELPAQSQQYASEDLKANFERIYKEVLAIFN